MDVRRQLQPGRDFGATLGAWGLASTVLVIWPGTEFPVLHNILDTSVFMVAGMLALMLWDLGWRTGEPLVRYKAVVFAVFAALEFLHVITALELYAGFPDLRRAAEQFRPGTWPPPAYLLPLGLGAAAWVRKRDRGSNLSLALVMCGAAAILMFLFQKLPRYTPPGLLGITRPALALVPLLWIPVARSYWRRREIDRIAHAIAYYAVVSALANAVMLYSRAPADSCAMIAHLGVFGGGMYLLLSLWQMGAVDTARRMRTERELKDLNETLELRVAERTREIESANVDLRSEVDIRQHAERRSHAQLARLHLLQQITHAIGERQDLDSIFQVVVGHLEDHMPVDFACLCQYDPNERRLTVAAVGKRSASLAGILQLGHRAQLPTDENGLTRCLRGELVYEPDVSGIDLPFTQRLWRGGLRSVVLAPLLIEQRSGVFGVLLVARVPQDSFSSTDCEFLSQLSEHVALATNQSQLHTALVRAYDDLRDTQNAVLQQERLRALGQMASGIAHDINNAISPASLYLETILDRDSTLQARTRSQLEIVQRAIHDVAQTVGRMGEFYRQREPQTALQPVNVNEILRQIPDLTRARWSDMAQARGAAIDVRIDVAPEPPKVLGMESEIREALINLVFNAADAMPKGGTITLRSRHTPVSERAASRHVIVEVADDGSGMDEDTRARCLEPFFTTKGERGTGLGLAMVYGIAQRHGADLQIDSAVGEGTTVRLLFPDAPTSTGSTTLEALRGPAAPRRILVVDDDPLLLRSLRDALEHEGHEVFCAHGGQAGIDTFLASLPQEPFPIVITDLGMPHVDGRQVAAAVKAAAPGTVVLMLTGWGQRLVETDDVPSHVDIVLNKPPNVWKLREALARAQGG